MRGRMWIGTVLVICVCAPYAVAEYIPPGQLVVKTEAYVPPADVQLPLGKYCYDVSWQGIPVGSAEITVAREKQNGLPVFVVEAKARTAKGIDIFYRLRHRSVSTFHADTMRPMRFNSEQKENSKLKEIQIVFEQDGLIRASVKKNDKLEKVEFQSGNLTLDPITAAFLARTLPVGVGSESKFDVFTGKHRFVITLGVKEQVEKEMSGQLRKAIKVVPKVEKLTDSEGETKLRSAVLWISEDSKREVLALESRVWIGSINARLASFTPNIGAAPAIPPGSSGAQQAEKPSSPP